MTKNSYVDKLHINYELTNNFATVQNILKRNGYGSHDLDIATNQILSLLAYKYLSENSENNKKDIGYELDEDYYYNNLQINKGNVIETLTKGIEQITQQNDNLQAADVFYDIFNLIDFEKFPENDTWILFIELVEKLCSNTSATIGEIFNFIIQYPKRGKNNIYQLKPEELLVKFITKDTVENIYDPFATSASLLVNAGNEGTVKNYYGQHVNFNSYVLAKLNLLVNNVNYKNIFFKHNDINNPNAWPDVKFDLCVSIPPFGRRDVKVSADDERFKPFSPRRASELAYILDMLYSLDDNGTIATIVPNGLLFRGGVEKKIIKHLVDNQFISTIIGLPANVFYETSIPTTLLILNKKPKEGIFYLNLETEGCDETNTIIPLSLRKYEDYVKIVDNKETMPFKTHIATLEEIQENDYNLSINRYVEHEQIDKINVELTLKNIKLLKMELKEVDEKINRKIEGLF